MAKRLVGILAVSGILVSANVAEVLPLLAQQAPGVPAVPPPPAADLERRVFQLEVVQSTTIDSLKSSNDYNRFLITVVSGIIALLVVTQSVVQGFTIFRQTRREEERDDRQARREAERDRTDRTATEQVSSILGVVEKTLESRFIAEEKARQEADRAKGELEKVLARFTALEQFYQTFQATIRHARQGLEERASRLVQVPRHAFKHRSAELSSFAQEFDVFRAQYEDLEAQPHPAFSARVPYIRGVAAHYGNQPEYAKQYLTEVVGTQQAEQGESEVAYKRRVANAYYYLGVSESNFGNNEDAIAYLERANALDPGGKDFLTRVVTAEVYAMSSNVEAAARYLGEVESDAQALESQGRLRSEHQRLRTRSALIRANMAIRARGDAWLEQAARYLEPAQQADRGYYYAAATLAQLRAASGDSTTAKDLFRDAYMTIQRSGDLVTVTEVRSRILLLMVAGMCSKHDGTTDPRISDEHLDKADDLRQSLPKVGSQPCTVYSPLSKQNESAELAGHHIQLIRQGMLFPEFAAA